MRVLAALLLTLVFTVSASAQTDRLVEAVGAEITSESGPGLAQAVADALTDDHKLTASDAAALDQFGVSVSLSGDRALVAASKGDCTAGLDCGSAYVFDFDGVTWTETSKLTASDAATDYQFGRAVSLSGDRALVGASKGDCAAGPDCGSAYVFDFDGVEWTETAKLTASDAATGDLFGWSVSLSVDRALIGAPGDGAGGPDSGSAYVFAFDGVAWTEASKLTASDAAASDQFGFSVSLSGDRALVAAHRDDDAGSSSGSAYVFDFDGVAWTEASKLTASDAAANDFFGNSLSLSVDRALVGSHQDDDAGSSSGSAYVFDFDGVAWTETSKLTASDAAANDQFGRAVSLSGDRALVGAYGNDDGGVTSGSAYVFGFDGVAWSETSKLTASDAAAHDHFGQSSVSLSDDRALVGAALDDDGGTNSGSAYVFDLANPPISISCVLNAANPPPLTIPAAGQTVFFDFDITNSSGGPYTAQFWLNTTGPVNLPEIGPITRLIGAGGISLTLRLKMTAAAPAGTWTRICDIGDAYPTSMSTSSFSFDKSALFAPGDVSVNGLMTEAEFRAEFEAALDAALAEQTAATAELPTSATLDGNYPNPLNPSTTIRFSLPESADVRLVVYDVLGRQVRVLLDGTRQAGTHEVVFAANNLPSGMYFYRLKTPQGAFTRTMILTK